MASPSPPPIFVSPTPAPDDPDHVSPTPTPDQGGPGNAGGAPLLPLSPDDPDHVSPTPTPDQGAGNAGGAPLLPLSLAAALRALPPPVLRRVSAVLWLRVLKAERRFARRLLHFEGAGVAKDAELTTRKLVDAGSVTGLPLGEGQLVGIGALRDAGSAAAGDAHMLLGVARIVRCAATNHRSFAAAAAAEGEANGLTAAEARARDAGPHALKPGQTLYRWELDQHSIVRFHTPVRLPPVFGSFGTLGVNVCGTDLVQLPAAFDGHLALTAVPPKLTQKQKRQRDAGGDAGDAGGGSSSSSSSGGGGGSGSDAGDAGGAGGSSSSSSGGGGGGSDSSDSSGHRHGHVATPRPRRALLAHRRKRKTPWDSPKVQVAMRAHKARRAKAVAKINAEIAAIDAACAAVDATEAGAEDAEEESLGEFSESDFEHDLVHFHTPPPKRRRRGAQFGTARDGVAFADEY